MQTVVVGAGVVGLAAARALARRGREVVVVEAEALIGSGVSSRNSEVVHAGIYYPRGSAKARACVAGRERLYAFCAERGVAHRKCGKLIVAADAAQSAQLDGIAAASAANGVPLRRLTAAEARALEPELRCEGALLSPETGIVDTHGFMLALQGDAEAHGAAVALESPVTGLRLSRSGFELDVAGETFACEELVLAAGLGTPALGAALVGPEAAPRGRFAKGSYFRLAGAPSPFSRLVYPVPEPGGLGVHATLDLGGQTRFGPDVEWVDSADASLVVDRRRADGFYAAVRRYWPALPDGALEADYAGMRPKIHGTTDFRVETHGVPGLVALYGIESPGLTGAMELGSWVCELLSREGP